MNLWGSEGSWGVVASLIVSTCLPWPKSSRPPWDFIDIWRDNHWDYWTNFKSIEHHRDVIAWNSTEMPREAIQDSVISSAKSFHGKNQNIEHHGDVAARTSTELQWEAIRYEFARPLQAPKCRFQMFMCLVCDLYVFEFAYVVSAWALFTTQV